jgi:hypothetical protein
VLGRNLEFPENRAIVERAAAEGHIIGNHGYSHQKLTHLTDEQIRTEFRHTEALIGNLDGGVKLWRPPLGDHDHRVDSVMAALGYTRVLWNVDTLDWRVAPWVQRTRDAIRLRVARGFRNTVCLLHDAIPATAAQLPDLLDQLEKIDGTRIARYDPSHPDGLRPADAVSFWVGDSLVVSRANSTLYVLNPSAALLWETLAGGASQAEAAQALARHFDIAGDLAAADVRAALADWRTRGLLGPKPPELEDPGPWLHSLDEVTAPAVSRFEEETAYRFLDFRFRVRFQTATLAAEIRPRFANLEIQETSSKTVFDVLSIAEGCGLRLSKDAVTVHASAAGLAYHLLFEIMRRAHPDLDPMACLHSSLLDCGGRTAAFVGNNGSGKSTLTAALASSGMRILSDDRLFLDFTTQLPAAAPNAVGLKRGSWSPLLSRYPGILQLPLVCSKGEEVRFLLPPVPTEASAAPVMHMFFPRFSAAAATAAIPLTAIQSIERIAAAEGWISSDAEKLRAFLRWVEQLRCYDLPFSDLDAAVECIGECLRS